MEMSLPIVLPLAVVAAIVLRVRGKTVVWGSFGAGAGAVAGLVALIIAEVVTGGWAEYPMVRGSVAQALVIATFVAATATASEVVLRGWIVEWVREVTGVPVMAVIAGAFAEALITPGGPTVRIGAALFGIGLGWMYIRAGLRAPLCARLVFALGAVLLEAAQLV
jgi:hypothetical protein